MSISICGHYDKRGESMTITLTDELEELLNEKVRSGAYKSADEVIMASLRLLKAQEKGMEALRREIMRGVEDIQQGRFTTYE
jgi:antitoxin ParD1/3/4